MHIIFDKIDGEIDKYFCDKYQWYRDHYEVMQLINMLRILPYAKESKVIEYLKSTITGILSTICSVEEKKNLYISEKPKKIIQSIDAQCRSLIVPVAADKLEYADDLPYVFGLDHNGITICIKSILGMDLSKFDHIYFTILRKHDQHYFLSDSMNLQFKRLNLSNAKVVILDTPTRDQAETIYRTIKQESIEGSIFVKDADSYFEAEIEDTNGLSVYPIEDIEILEPRDKSYVAIDDMYYITNVIEKSVIGHHISSGGYMFESADSFMYYYDEIKGFGKIYLSHIIYAMLLDNIQFRPILTKKYQDWGSRSLFNINRNLF